MRKSVHKLCLRLTVVGATVEALAKVQSSQVPSKLSEKASLLQVLLPLRSSTLAKVSKLAIELHQAIHVMPELWCLTVWDLQQQ